MNSILDTPKHTTQKTFSTPMSVGNQYDFSGVVEIIIVDIHSERFFDMLSSQKKSG